MNSVQKIKPILIFAWFVLHMNFSLAQSSYTPLTANTTLSNVAGKLRIGKIPGAGTVSIGAYKDVAVSAGASLVFTFYYSNVTLSSNPTASIAEIGNPGNIQSQVLTANGTYTLNISSTIAATFRIQFSATTNNKKSFDIDNVNLAQTVITTTSNCVNYDDYRYGFNKQEKDDEISGKGNSMTAEFWQYDPRLGRRWNMDPQYNSSESPYAVYHNNPIYYNDIKGNKGESPLKKAAKEFGNKVDAAHKEMLKSDPEATIEDAIAKVVDATTEKQDLYITVKSDHKPGGGKGFKNFEKYTSYRVADLYRHYKAETDLKRGTRSVTPITTPSPGTPMVLEPDPTFDKVAADGFTTNYIIPAPASGVAVAPSSIVVSEIKGRPGTIDLVVGYSDGTPDFVRFDIPVEASGTYNIPITGTVSYVTLTEKVSTTGSSAMFNVILTPGTTGTLSTPAVPPPNKFVPLPFIKTEEKPSVEKLQELLPYDH